MRTRTVAVVVAGLVLAGSGGTAFAASPGVPQSGVVATVPSAKTPNFFGGSVQAITQVGDLMIAGGSFTSVGAPGSSTGNGHKYVVAFNATTGAISSSFNPTLDGAVSAIVPNSAGTGVYLGGSFKKVGTKATRLAELSVGNGALVTGFNPPAISAVITDIALGGSPARLYVGGKFGIVGGVAHSGLAAFNPTTGALDPYVSIQLTEHHNYGRVTGAVSGSVGAENVALNPAGNRLIVDGNFRTARDGVGTYTRDQIVSINLGPSAATIDPNWNTASFTQPCFANAYDSYVRDVGWSPDGTYFVVTASGGYHGGTFENCDAVSRWEASAVGTSVKPTWITHTGTDSVYSVAVTNSAVYVGGHQRWLNNPYGQDRANVGAVPRPGLAALDPRNGIPLSWNPGRNPRGHGAELVYATAAGVWVGSDTDYIGDRAYRRARLAFFPLAGGTPASADNAGKATRIFQGGATSTTSFTARTFDPTSGAGQAPATVAASGAPVWGDVRGAFYLNGRVWYGLKDGNFYYRTFNGSSFGPQMLIDPYNDPRWSNVATGSTSGTTPILYRGLKPGFYGTTLANVTGMFYDNGAIYYTVSGRSGLYKRAFSPDTAPSSVSTQVTGGVISPVEQTVASSGFTGASGMFLGGGKLYVAVSGSLRSVPFSGGVPVGTPVADAAAGTGWSGRAMFTSPS